jgi:mono/diheme cytochrome c family protein
LFISYDQKISPNTSNTKKRQYFLLHLVFNLQTPSVMKTFLKFTGVALLVFVIGIFAFVQFAWDKKHEAPVLEFTASTDSAMIARGKYLAFGPAHCATCHVPMDKIMDVEGGLEIPLSGGWELPIPPGTFRAPNLTPDPETGIGNMSDAQLARALRYNIKRGQHLPVFHSCPSMGFLMKT